MRSVSIYANPPIELSPNYEAVKSTIANLKTMKLTFLGTAAANAFPEAFCQCENCQSARSYGAPSLRKRSAAIVNDDLLIDLGPDIMSASQIHRRPLTNIRYCLQTHAHADHLDASHFLSRSPGFGVIGAPRLNFLRVTCDAQKNCCNVSTRSILRQPDRSSNR
jgi:hypothetical protein